MTSKKITTKLNQRRTRKFKNKASKRPLQLKRNQKLNQKQKRSPTLPLSQKLNLKAQR